LFCCPQIVILGAAKAKFFGGVVPFTVSKGLDLESGHGGKCKAIELVAGKPRRAGGLDKKGNAILIKAVELLASQSAYTMQR
jgi:hypothetical protein